MTGTSASSLAGYVNTVSQWSKFADAWDAELHAHPSIEYLHMVEAQNLRDQFDGWPEVDRDKKVLDLATVIRDHEPWSIQCSVSRNDYTRIVRPVAPRGLGNPYFSCFYGIVISLARFHHEQGIATPVDFVFDEQGGLGTEAVMFYEYIKSLQIPEVEALLGSTPVFRDDEKVLPLQAADVLAWHIRREHAGEVPAGYLPSFDLLRADGRHVVVDINSDVLETMASRMRDVPGVSEIQSKSQWRKIKRVIQHVPHPNELIYDQKHKGNVVSRAFRRITEIIRGR